jgi:very-short-patch-repair endonuclease
VAGGIPLVRRQWLLLPSAPDGVREAARVGGRLTCVSEAQRLGLWIPRPDARPHIAVPPHSDARPDGIAHWSRGPAPAARLLADPIENVLHHVASCVAELEAFAIWESAIRKRRIVLEAVRRTRWTTTAARRLASLVGALSDAGTESFFVRQCRAAGIPCRQQVHLYGRDVDAVIGDHLVVQIDGFAHHADARQRRDDLAHDRVLHLRGYTVLRFTYADVVHRWPDVERQLRTAMAQGAHR